ncbi:MAG: 1-acyl-sn-glycerol-3-phosphate acyltransferase [Moorea sp. SIO2B7]|nr:1-acyl-sn-glycerol-3-phosphate acyltransferase [Moorena sp. SIO2B7]
MTNPAKFDSHLSPWLTSFLYPLAKYTVMPLYFGRLEVTGQENIPRTGPVIIASNHCSRWDGIIVGFTTGRIATGRDLRYMVSANEMNGLQGWLLRRLGGFPVDTCNPRISSLRHSVDLLREGQMLVIFPEGSISRDKKVHPLKRGLGRIALQVEAEQPGSGLKIVPMSIDYSQPYPNWGCDVKVDIGLPLNVADYNGTSMKKSSQKLTTALETALKQLHEEKATQNSFSIMAA